MWYNGVVAVVAQLAEQLIRNEQVAGSTPVNGSIFCLCASIRSCQVAGSVKSRICQKSLRSFGVVNPE